MAHVVDFYDEDAEIVAELAAYVLAGWARQETVLVVATDAHVRAMDAALVAAGHDPVTARLAGRYLTLDAAETLRGFMVDAEPRAAAFHSQLGALVAGLAGRGRPVRIFGEMVALLWAEGNIAAALALESLWNELATRHSFSLMCAYPTQVLDHSWLSDVRQVCELHSQVEPPAGYTRPGPYASHATRGGDVGSRRSRVFLPTPQAVPAMRRFVTQVLQDWQDDLHLAPSAEGEADTITANTLLACSEMATNAVVHARSPFLLTVHRSAGGVLVAVEDAGDGSARRQATAPMALGGRGLAIVQAVADRWGCEPLTHGKVVWAQVSPHPAGVADRAV